MKMELPERNRTEVFAAKNPGFVTIMQHHDCGSFVSIHCSDVDKLIAMLKRAEEDARDIEAEEAESDATIDSGIEPA